MHPDIDCPGGSASPLARKPLLGEKTYSPARRMDFRQNSGRQIRVDPSDVSVRFGCVLVQHRTFAFWMIRYVRL